MVLAALLGVLPTPGLVGVPGDQYWRRRETQHTL